MTIEQINLNSSCGTGGTRDHHQDDREPKRVYSYLLPTPESWGSSSHLRMSEAGKWTPRKRGGAMKSSLRFIESKHSWEYSLILYPENIFRKRFAMLNRAMQGDMACMKLECKSMRTFDGNEDKTWYERNCKERHTYDYLWRFSKAELLTRNTWFCRQRWCTEEPSEET